MNASNTSSSLLRTKFSQLPNLHTFISSSLFSVLAVLALHPSLLLLGHLHHPVLKLLTAPCGMLHRVSGINYLYLFVNLILVPVPPVPTHPLLHLSLLPLLFHHSAHPTPSLFHSRLKTCFTNRIPCSSTFFSCTAFTDFCLHGLLPAPFL